MESIRSVRLLGISAPPLVLAGRRGAVRPVEHVAIEQRDTPAPSGNLKFSSERPPLRVGRRSVGPSPLHGTGRGHHEAGNRYRMAAGDRGHGRGAARDRLGRGRRGEPLRGPPPRVPGAAPGARGHGRPARRLAGTGRGRPPGPRPSRGPGGTGRTAGRPPGDGTHRVRTRRRAAQRLTGPGGRASAACPTDLGRARRAVRERADRAGLAARAAGPGEHRGADLLARRGVDRGPVPRRAGRAHRRTPAHRRRQSAHQSRQPRRGPLDRTRRAPRGGHRLRPRGGRRREGRRLARHPRPPRDTARPRRAEAAPLPRRSAGSPAGARRRLPAGRGAGR